VIVLATSSAGVSWRDRPVVTHELSCPTGEEAFACWRSALNIDDHELIPEVATAFARNTRNRLPIARWQLGLPLNDEDYGFGNVRVSCQVTPRSRSSAV